MLELAELISDAKAVLIASLWVWADPDRLVTLLSIAVYNHKNRQHK